MTDVFAMARKVMHGMICTFVDEYIDYYVDLEGTEDDDFLHTAESFGIVKFREPTAEEFADPQWFGHKLEYQADSLCVCEKTPEFIAMVESEQASRTKEIEGAA